MPTTRRRTTTDDIVAHGQWSHFANTNTIGAILQPTNTMALYLSKLLYIVLWSALADWVLGSALAGWVLGLLTQICAEGFDLPWFPQCVRWASGVYASCGAGACLRKYKCNNMIEANPIGQHDRFGFLYWIEGSRHSLSLRWFCFVGKCLVVPIKSPRYCGMVPIISRLKLKSNEATKANPHGSAG